MRHIIRGLIRPGNIELFTNEFRTENGSFKPEKLASKLSGLPPSRKLRLLQTRLDRTIRKTGAQIKAEIHSRLVFGIGCVPMILIGIGLGIIKKGGHLLTAFAASCIPAAVLIVCIMSGKNITQNLSTQAVSGLTVMWAGLGFMCLLAIVMFYRLLKR